MYVCTELDPSLVVSHSRKESTGSTGDVTFVSAVLYCTVTNWECFFSQQKKKGSSINSPLSSHPQARLLSRWRGDQGGFFLSLPPGVCLSACRVAGGEKC